ncbi:MAG: HlyD family secretion protein [Cyclobacteriaceae bacterium]|nr:HlyD family secretion protein [Cyclobacteriaceae bacterium]
MKISINWFYIFVALLFVSMLYVSARFFKGSGKSSIGITKGKEYKINSEKSSLVKRVYVVPGRQVKAGDVLVELTSNELEIDIDKLTNRIAVLKSEQHEKSKLVESEIAYVKAQHGITIEEIDTDIEQIQSKMELNRNLAREFAPVATDSTSVNLSRNPQQAKLKSLAQQKAKHHQAMAIKIEDIRQENTTEQSLLVNQIRLLERELELLAAEKKKLSKFAATDGVVENVYVKDGEQVDSFTPLLSINPVRPSTVVGYLVGKKFDIPEIGSAVRVSSYEHRSVTVAGKVIGYGSVSELPEILQKSTAVKAFGREMFIEIAPENSFANGEKVLIR